MSATMRVNDFVGGRLFNEPPPAINVETRQFVVTIHFLKRTEIVHYIGQAYKTIVSICRRLPEGGILVLFTGQRETEYLRQKLHKTSRKMICNISKGHGGDEDVCTYDEDPANLDQYDLHSSDDSEIELAIDDNDYLDDYEESFDLKMLEEGGDPIGNVVKLVSLKATFEALAGNKPLESENKVNLPIIRPAAKYNFFYFKQKTLRASK
ncbi:hypothetical protein Sjap_015210 [Stephania japonica]|uniref:Uncharacterized protein n=1 Tax=Stephania japonica TaxID=461633 RepID=A0AAP0IIT9_9MAGN